MDPLQMPQGQGQPMGEQEQLGPDGKPVSMATPEQKQKFMELLNATRDKVGEFNAKSFASDNTIQAQKNESLGKLFQMLQASGIDLTDPVSISEFLKNLRTKNPPLSKMVEEALNQLLGDEPQDQGQPQQELPQGVPPGMPQGMPPQGGQPIM